MIYHISTTLIIDNFKKQCECPLCEIERKLEKDILTEYSGEAVMVDEAREKVNELGFCGNHFTMLYEGENKLGTALQAKTRLDTIYKQGKLANIKNYKKVAENLLKTTSTCLICENIEKHMNRYIETVPKMFLEQTDFEKLFSATKGFCLKHHALLLSQASRAGKKTENFILVLNNIWSTSITSLSNDLQTFCNKFDYRNKDLPLGTAINALPRAITKMTHK